MRISVVVASKNRPELLVRLVTSLRGQLSGFGDEGELIVVDDGSEPPYDPVMLPGATLLRGAGAGPARARNLGIRAASGEIVAFTDDDVTLDPGWLRGAVAHLETHTDEAGVTGETTAPEHNAVYEHAVDDHVGGSFLTCNVAYRRVALLAVGGFDQLFRHAHEDRDLAWRIIDTVGPVGFEPAMRVTHPGRAFSVREAWRRADFLYDDWLLFSRYPDRRAGSRSIRWTPLANALRTWRNVFVTCALWRHPVQAARWTAITGGLLVRILWLTLTAWRSLGQRDSRAVPGLSFDRWRLAYVGPSPNPSASGAPGVAGLLLDQLLASGHSVDCFVAASKEDDDPRGLGDRAGLTYVIGRSGFEFGRWYSNHRITKMLSLQLFAGFNRRRLAARLAAAHRASPYDFVYQFSTFESVGVPRGRSAPPVVIHPSVHAAGERRWVRREASLGLSADGTWRRIVVTTWLALRATIQRRDARRAAGLLAISAIFADEIARDYGVDRSRIEVVPNCIDLQHLDRADPSNRDLMVVGRLAVRKGLEDVVALSKRLGEIDATLRLRIIGAPSLWSDYRLALEGLDVEVSVVEGGRTRAQVFEEVAGALALLQLSRYEPFGLTVAEALALGVPVIVTPAVGSAEELAEDVKVVVAPGDVDAIVSAVASMAALRDDERLLLSHRCRHEATRLFAPSVVAARLELAIEALLTRRS